MTNVLEIMKTLRVLVGLLFALGISTVSAGSFQYDSRYMSQSGRMTVGAGSPVAMMKSTASGMMSSGSMLPMAAATGISTTYDTQVSAGPRRVRPGDNEDPFEDPVGDGVLPLLLMAAVAALAVMRRRRKAAEDGAKASSHTGLA